MATHSFPESDWKVFRQLQQIALERFCQRTLEEVQTILRDGSRNHHERYRHIFGLLQERDDDLAEAFDNPRRSDMIRQLAAMCKHDLLEAAEVERFAEGTRETIAWLTGKLTR